MSFDGTPVTESSLPGRLDPKYSVSPFSENDARVSLEAVFTTAPRFVGAPQGANVEDRVAA